MQASEVSSPMDSRQRFRMSDMMKIHEDLARLLYYNLFGQSGEKRIRRMIMNRVGRANGFPFGCWGLGWEFSGGLGCLVS